MIELHSCSYFCERPDCIKTQRDEMRDNGTRLLEAADGWKESAQYFQQERNELKRELAALRRELQHQTYAYGIEFERAEKAEAEYEKLQKATVYELQGYTEAARSVIAMKAENAALLDWERRCAIALGVPGCSPEEMLNVIDSQREDAERYRWFRSKRLWDADQFPWPKDFEYPEPCLWDEGKMLDAAIDAVRKK